MRIMFVVPALLLAQLALPTVAVAQDLPTFTFAGAATADWVSTRINAQYKHEINPTINWLSSRPTAMVALGAGMDVGSYLVWRRVTRNHKRVYRIGLYAATGFRLYWAVHNTRINRGIDRWPAQCKQTPAYCTWK